MSALSDQLAALYPTVAARLPRFEKVLRDAPRIRVQQAWVRVIPVDKARTPPPGATAPDVLWTGGTSMAHNRYVRQGLCPALHLGDGLTTAGAEVFRIHPSPAPVLGVPESTRLLVRIETDVPEVLDLTDAKLRRRLRVTKRELTEVPNYLVLDALDRPCAYELPQAIGEIAFRLKLGGILYPSARATRGTNFVVFADHLACLGGSVRTEDPWTGEPRSLP